MSSFSSTKKYTKHKKKYWRKGINTTDVEDNITEQRRVQLLHDLAANKPDNELYTLEGTVNQEGQAKRKPLTSEYHCANHSMITLPVQQIKQNKLTNNYEVSSDEENEIHVPKEHTVSHRNVTMATAVKKRGLSLLRSSLIETKPSDIWSDEATPTNNNSIPQRPVGAKKGRSLSNIANLELPHSGTSYNPCYFDHQNLLYRATQDEERKLVKYNKLCTSIKMTPMDSNQREEQWLLEATEGLEGKQEVDEETGSDCSDLEIAIPKFVTKRKTRQQKNRELAQKQATVKRQEAKLEKNRFNEVFRIKSIKKEIVAQEKLRQANMQRRALRKSLRKTLRVGKYKYEKPSIDVQLSSELCGSLRLLQSTGSSLINERYMSLQKRNIVEPKGPSRSVKKSTIKKR